MTEWLAHYEYGNSKRKKLAKSVVAIFEFENLKRKPLKASGSGFLRDEWTVVTAEHVVGGFKENPIILVCVFDFFQVNNDATTKIRVNKVILRGHDCALLDLKQEVGNRTQLETATTDKLSENNKVFVIGYPWGEPVKFSPDCDVLEVKDDFFYIELEPPYYLSGAPVINSETLRVEGIISGKEDTAKTKCVKTRFFT